MKQEKPFYKKWWFWLLVFLFLLVMGNMNTQKTAPAEPSPAVEATTKEEPQEEKDPITAIIDEQGFSLEQISRGNNFEDRYIYKEILSVVKYRKYYFIYVNRAQAFIVRNEDYILGNEKEFDDLFK